MSDFIKHCILIPFLTLAGSVFIAAQTTAFVGVNVIPMDRERVVANQTVLVKEGVIAEIGDAGTVKVPKDALRVDGRGKYLIPGLVDMHTHMLSDDDFPKSIAEDELRVMVANGVTTIRFMIGTPEQLILRARSARGEIIAPTIYSASPQMTGREQGNNYVVRTPDEGREAVRRSKAAGYDFIKVTTFVDAKTYEAIADECVKQKIRLIGHADSRFVTVPRAWAARQQIEHLDGYLEMLLRDDAPMKGSVSDLYIYNPKNWESIDYVDEKKIAEVARKTVESNPFVDPTQSFMKNTFGLPRSDESIRAQPDFRFYPQKTKDFYMDYMKRTPLNQVSWERRARWVDIRNKMIKAIHDAGGKIMVGSDTPEFLWLYGFTEHREMKALADAGMPNYAVLVAATRNAHEYLGTLARSGTVEKGKQADLVLLDADPLDNITNTEKRAGVMLKGKWYPQTELNRWLDEIAPRIANSLPADDPKDASLDGPWQGEVERNGRKWNVGLDVRNFGTEKRATVDFADLDAYEVPFPIKAEGDHYHLERPQPGGKPIVFDGRVESGVFAGKWSGFGVDGTFSMKKAPFRPRNYREEEVTFKNGEVTLSGTLLSPVGVARPPVVVIVHGSTPNERTSYRSWARHFTNHGIAALVFDKRGSGQSTGNTDAASMQDLADDAIAGVEMLKSRPDIDGSKIGVIGHSQGGWIAPLAASRSKDVAFMIVSGAAAVTPAEQSIYHREGVMRDAGMTAAEIENATRLRERLYDIDRRLLANEPAAAADRAALSNELGSLKGERWFGPSALPASLGDGLPPRGSLELLLFDVRPVWEKLNIPVLAVWGDRDSVVPVEKSRQIIQSALEKAGNSRFTFITVPGLDHGNTLASADGQWDFPRASPETSEKMVEWLLKLLKG